MKHRLTITLLATCAPAGFCAAQPVAGFTSTQDIVQPAGTSFLRAALPVDLDDDGDDDVVTYSDGTPLFPQPNVIELWENDAGAWVLRDSITLAFDARHIGLGDANGDGRPDVTLGEMDAAGVMLNQGTMSLLGPFMFPVEGTVIDVKLADVTGDGNADLVASTLDDLFTVRRGLGSGVSFQFVTNIPAPTEFTQIRDGELRIADLNDDGDLDVVTAADNGTNINIFYASGGGNFFGGLFTTVVAVGDNVNDIMLADLTGDGDPEIIAAISGGTTNVSVYENDYDGGAEPFPGFDDTPPAMIPINALGAGALAMADLSCPRDGLPDLIVRTRTNVGTSFLTAGVHRALPSGGFDPDPVYLPERFNAGRALLADLDDDGETDFIAASATLTNESSINVDAITNLCCPADTNLDGSLTPADFNAWIIAFNMNSPLADQNADGLITAADFNAWIANFNAGC